MRLRPQPLLYNADNISIIDLTIAGDVTVNNNSQISADTQGAGEGGNINIQANNLNLNNQGQVSVNSDRIGQAGNIENPSQNLRGESV